MSILKKGVILLFVSLTAYQHLHAQKVTLDYFYNHELRKGPSGKSLRFHYTWEDTSLSGFSILGDLFIANGFTLDTLSYEPDQRNLGHSRIYIIVDPDTKKENPAPHYIQGKAIDAISTWVGNGGVLLMLANDSANVELPHFNDLTKRYGLHFKNDLQNHVIDDQHFQDGGVTTKHCIFFSNAKKIFLKDACSIAVTGPVITELKNKNNATLLVCKYFGKGIVIAVGDPWLYNEYMNGRLPSDFQNREAANDLISWLRKYLQKKGNFNQ